MARTRPIIGACIAILLLGAGLSAQKRNQDPGTRNLEGFVTDAAGQRVAKAVVQLKNTKNLQIRSFITQEDGSYHFMGLSADVEYQVKAEHDGAASSWKDLSVFNSKKTPLINLKLKVKK
ncbi:MAG: carboxypeptidase-like regulatory domain-containing protein [Bryobacteraceae bacterium]